MRRHFAILALSFSIAGCAYTAADQPLAGVEPVNVPVVTRTDLAYDAPMPDGTLSAAEAARLDAWFRSLQLGYGDSVHVDADYPGARQAIANVTGKYGLLLSDGMPVTTGTVLPGFVRVVVSRTRATVPNCPNWSVPAQPNYGNLSMSNLGCAVNANLAAMVANSEDLVRGQEGGLADSYTATRAVDSYRKSTPTGGQTLSSANSKGNK